MHTSFALNALTKYYVGKALNEFQIFKDPKQNLTSDTVVEMESKIDSALLKSLRLDASQNWKLETKTQISSNIFRFEFIDPSLLLRTRIDKIQHFGKHFKVV